MARFLAAIQGSRGEATRLGSASHGIRAQAQGWSLGVKVYGNSHTENGDLDAFTVYVTGGSNGGFSSIPLATVLETDNGFTVSPIGGDTIYFDKNGNRVTRYGNAIPQGGIENES